MSTTRRRTPAVLAAFALATTLLACADFATSPKSAAPGPRSLRDSTGINWNDTLECRNGWITVNGLVECGPQ